MKNLIYLFLFYFIFPGYVLASDRSIVCEKNGCKPTEIKPLFSHIETWYPGKSESETISITNNTDLILDTNIIIKNYVPQNNDDRIIFGEIVNLSNNKIVYKGSIGDIFYANKKKPISLGQIAVHKTELYRINIFIPKEIGNVAQGNIVSFDIEIGFVYKKQNAEVLGTTTQSSIKKYLIYVFALGLFSFGILFAKKLIY